MVKKQRLALAISSALSLLVGTGCSTTSAMKATVIGNTSSEVTVHHILYQKPTPNFRQQNKPYGEKESAIRENQLNEEINALALKLGLSSYSSEGFIAEKKTSFQPIIKHAVYRPNNETIRKAVARREGSVRYAGTSEL